MRTNAKPIHAGDIVRNGDVGYILDGVKSRTLPKAQWTHCAHLLFACGLLHDLGLNGAEAAAPSLIKQYNEATGVQNTDTDGYHHTLTIFFLRQINKFLFEREDDEIGSQATALLSSPLASSDYPLTFYSKARLFCVEARHQWVEPDRHTS